MLFPNFVYITHFTKSTHGSSLFMNNSLLMEKSKVEESPQLKNRPKEERKSTILLRKEKNSFRKATGTGGALDSLTSSSAHFTVFPFLPRVFPLPLRRPCRRSTERNLDHSSLKPEGPIVLLVCGFRRRDNLLAWRELFVNLYELKSRI